MAFLKSVPARRFVATIAAAATALALMTAAAVPARANETSDDIAKGIAAAMALIIICNALTENNKGHATPAPRQPDYQKDVGHGRPDRQPDWDNGRRPDRGYRTGALPAECAIGTNYRHHGSKTVYTERCLRRAGIDRRLPQYCAIDVRVNGRRQTAYPESCLVDAGFRSRTRARRH